MKVSECAALAAAWVRENESPRPGYIGAYVGGSSAALPPDSEITGGSDLDVYVVFESPGDAKPGKFIFRGALLEISYIALASVYPAEKAIRDYHLANSLRYMFILDDPSGVLNETAHETASGFSLRENIAARRDHAIERVKSGLSSPSLAPSLPDRTLSWLFPTGITTHAVLVSALKNPTVRMRYVRAREVLMENKMEHEHEALLDLSGFGTVTRETALRHLKNLSPAFDAAGEKSTTYFFFKSDVSPQSRPAAIDASRALIDTGLHREAMFWIITTWARAMKMLEVDSPMDYERYLPEFEELLNDVGRGNEADIRNARRRVLSHIPELIKITDGLISAYSR